MDEIPLPPAAGVPGRLWLAGKRYVAPDPEAALAEVGADLVVCLCETTEIDERFPPYVRWLQAESRDEGGRAIWFPIPDLHAPGLEPALDLMVTLLRHLRSGDSVIVHCGAGFGRAGTVAAGILILLGATPEEAVSTVAAARPLAGPEAGAQAELLESIAAHARARQTGPCADPGPHG